MPELERLTHILTLERETKNFQSINHSLVVPRLFSLYPVLVQKYIITMGFWAQDLIYGSLTIVQQWEGNRFVFTISLGSDRIACNIDTGQLQGGWLNAMVWRESVTCTTFNYKTRQTWVCHQSFYRNAFSLMSINGQTAKWTKPVRFTRGSRRWETGQVTVGRFLLVPCWLVSPFQINFWSFEALLVSWCEINMSSELPQIILSYYFSSGIDVPLTCMSINILRLKFT